VERRELLGGPGNNRRGVRPRLKKKRKGLKRTSQKKGGEQTKTHIVKKRIGEGKKGKNLARGRGPGGG